MPDKLNVQHKRECNKRFFSDSPKVVCDCGAEPLRILPADEMRSEVGKILEMPLVGALNGEFVAVHKAIMRDSECIGWARSHTMAKRIANALNAYAPNHRGY